MMSALLARLKLPRVEVCVPVPAVGQVDCGPGNCVGKGRREFVGARSHVNSVIDRVRHQGSRERSPAVGQNNLETR
jgi:hypothetical protein